MKRVVKLTKYEYKICMDFAKETAQYHGSHGRTEEQVIDSIMRGKLGEIAFFKMCEGQVSEPMFEHQEIGDRGWDVVSLKSGNRIDVKTIQRGKRFVTVNKNRLNADVYAVVELDIDSMEAHFIGIKYKNEVNEEAKPSKFNKLHYFKI